MGGAQDRRAPRRPGAAAALVQPLRPAAGLGGDDAAQGGRGLVLLPALPHGPAARGRHAQAGARRLSPRMPPAMGICQWFHFEDHRLDEAVGAGCGGWACATCAPGCSWADSLPRGALDWFDRQMAALADFEVTVTFCFTPEAERRGAAPHQPAAATAGVRRVLRRDGARLRAGTGARCRIPAAGLASAVSPDAHFGPGCCALVRST